MDFTYSYTDDTTGTIISFQTVPHSSSLEYEPEDFAQLMHNKFPAEGMIVESEGKTVLNGNIAYQFTLINKEDNINLKQYFAQTKTNLIVIYCTYYPKAFKKVTPEVQTVLDSIKSNQ